MVDDNVMHTVTIRSKNITASCMTPASVKQILK